MFMSCRFHIYARIRFKIIIITDFQHLANIMQQKKNHFDIQKVP